MRALRNLVGLARDHGVVAAFRAARHRACERYYEWWFGVETGAEVTSDSLGFSSSEFHFYAATDYSSFFKVLAALRTDGTRDVLLDYGSGKGRALIAAAADGRFRRVIGVEIAETLAESARRNLAAANRRLRCKDVQVVAEGADVYTVPEEVSHVYLCNPFHGAILKESFRRLQESVRRNPRTITIICRLPEQSAMERELPGYPFYGTRREIGFSREIRYWIFEMNETTPEI